MELEVQKFASSAEFLEWAARLVRANDQHYARVPVGKQTWVYGNGNITETGIGRRGGTLLANLSFMRSTGTGALKSPGDERIVRDIDTCGGVALIIRWPSKERDQ